MLKMQYIGEEKFHQVEFKNISSNVVQLLGDYPVKAVGFIMYKMNGQHLSDYSGFKTVYREVDGGYQFSNDGSVYIPPVSKVSFYSDGGGTLEGETMQEVNDYSELVVPTPMPDEDYEFSSWSPEIPASGGVDGNTSFIAIFTSTAPEPTPDSSIEERVGVLEEDVMKINLALGGD